MTGCVDDGSVHSVATALVVHPSRSRAEYINARTQDTLTKINELRELHGLLPYKENTNGQL